MRKVRNIGEVILSTGYDLYRLSKHLNSMAKLNGDPKHTESCNISPTMGSWAFGKRSPIFGVVL
jgi:hypothetical protein